MQELRAGFDQHEDATVKRWIRTRRRGIPAAVVACVLVAILAVPAFSHAEDRLVVYSGRAERFIQPALDAFQAESGVTVQLLTADSTALINRLRLEGARTSADVLITNDAGTLERARELHLLRATPIPDLEDTIPDRFRAPDDSWIGLSGRVWVVVYNTTMVNPDAISSILDLGDPQWEGRIAIPSAGSVYLQTGVSVIREINGEEMTIRVSPGLEEERRLIRVREKPADCGGRGAWGGRCRPGQSLLHSTPPGQTPGGPHCHATHRSRR